MNSKAVIMMIPTVFSVIAGVGCNGGSGSAGTAPGAAKVANISNPTQGAPTAQGSLVGTSCKSNDSNQICLGLKYVVYKNSKGESVVSQPDAVKNVDNINKLWKQCGIAFQIDEFVAADAPTDKLSHNPANMGELDDIRKVYSDANTLLVVTTGKWDRSGSLGNTGANAWTSMPGEDLYGAIHESTVGTFSNIMAHELGHYLNLDHMNDESDLMNPIIADSSTKLTQQQCASARASVSTYWQRIGQIDPPLYWRIVVSTSCCPS